jgi:hypothetical protein
MNDITDITYGMSQEELIKQCLFVITFPIENINYKELKQMLHKIDYPKDEYGFHDFKSDLWIQLEPVRKKLKELSYYYD